MYKNKTSFILMCIVVVLSCMIIKKDLFDIIKMPEDIDTRASVEYINKNFVFINFNMLILSVLPVIFYIFKGRLIASRNLLILFIVVNIAYLYGIGKNIILYHEYLSLNSTMNLIYIRFAASIAALLFYILKDYTYNTSFEVKL